MRSQLVGRAEAAVSRVGDGEGVLVNPETILKNQVKEALLRIGILVFSNAQAGRTYRAGLGPGSADLIAVVHGRFLGLELKTETGAASPDQLAWGDTVEDHGGCYAIVRSVDEAIAVVRLVAKWTPRPERLRLREAA